MSLVVQRPSRELLENAAANLHIYGTLRQAAGRDTAFQLWCEILELDAAERTQLAMVRIRLIQALMLGELTYDDIDWSGQDEDRRASSTGTVFVDSMEAWLEAEG